MKNLPWLNSLHLQRRLINQLCVLDSQKPNDHHKVARRKITDARAQHNTQLSVTKRLQAGFIASVQLHTDGQAKSAKKSDFGQGNPRKLT